MLIHRSLRSAFIASVLLIAAACAVVPNESVTLSETVGRDLVELHRSHRELVNLLYDRMEASVNALVDDVYAPYQIRHTAADAEVQPQLASASASLASSNADAATAALEVMATYFDLVRADVEEYRKLLLAPLKQQRAVLLKAVDESYGQVMTANAATTGYLASLVQVKDAQNELLAGLGVPDLQRRITDGAVELSNKLDAVNRQAGKRKEDLEMFFDEVARLISGPSADATQTDNR